MRANLAGDLTLSHLAPAPRLEDEGQSSEALVLLDAENGVLCEVGLAMARPSSEAIEEKTLGPTLASQAVKSNIPRRCPLESTVRPFVIASQRQKVMEGRLVVALRATAIETPR